MFNYKLKNLNYYFFLILLIILIYLFYFFSGIFQKETKIIQEPISINLLTSVHPKLSWNFKPLNPKIIVVPGEVVTVEYIVENIGEKDSTGIATFAYFPNELKSYIRKINCFCYDAQTLKPKQRSKFTLVLLIDPEVAKDSKTKQIKEATIQFTFFDFKEYKKKES
tara:strand:- start:3332 stop:3829 length:498 start_codon:yes stop_codon:yes gene_type:complete